eukprot:1691221-Heterocapsa_arctica.AAC.1
MCPPLLGVHLAHDDQLLNDHVQDCLEAAHARAMRARLHALHVLDESILLLRAQPADALAWPQEGLSH